MLNIFKQPDRFSDPPSGKSPAEKARSTYDSRIGSPTLQAYNWRRISIGLLICCVVLSVGLTVQSLKSQIVPYVVTVDKSTGEVEQAGALTAQSYSPSEAEIRYFISQFIQNSRSIQLDPIQQNKMQEKAYAFLTQSAAQKFRAIQQNEGFQKKYASDTIQVKINGIKKIPDTDSYHATWTEEDFNISTGEQKTTKYECVFNITTILPKDDATLLVNPLGLYISDLNFGTVVKDAQDTNGKTRNNASNTNTNANTGTTTAAPMGNVR